MTGMRHMAVAILALGLFTAPAALAEDIMLRPESQVYSNAIIADYKRTACYSGLFHCLISIPVMAVPGRIIYFTETSMSPDQSLPEPGQMCDITFHFGMLDGQFDRKVEPLEMLRLMDSFSCVSVSAPASN